MSSYPVTLVTGSRQVGKSTLALTFKEKGFNYVSLDNAADREMAINNPDMFLLLHPWPLIIDEVQRAPMLFDAIEVVVNNEKTKREDNYGMYILTGSQLYKSMRGVTQSMAGRVGIIHITPLSRNEILNRSDPLLNLSDYKLINDKAVANPLNPLDLYESIVKGFYPELYSKKSKNIQHFYSNYVETYIERDVSEIINIQDKLAFRRFMEVLASLTGEELVYDNLAKWVGINKRTVMSWLSILLAGDIVYLLEPYSETSITKRIVKRPKIYFSDTGLACYLAKLNDSKMLQASIFAGRFVETYIINEIRKNYMNNGEETNFYYYRDSNMNEINLVIVQKGKLHRIECKAGMSYNNKAVKGFKQLDNTAYPIGDKAIICNTVKIYVLQDDVYVIPLVGI